MVAKQKLHPGINAYYYSEPSKVVPPTKVVQAGPSEDDWESEMEGVVPYNPSAVAAQRLVIRSPLNMKTKSELKRHREEEFQRWAKIQLQKKDEVRNGDNHKRIGR